MPGEPGLVEEEADGVGVPRGGRLVSSIRSPTARAEAGAASLMRAMSVRAAAVSVVLSVKRR